MKEFKVGDRVKLIENNTCSDFKLGEIGTITEHCIEDSTYRFQDDTTKSTCGNWVNHSDLVLINEETSKEFVLGQTAYCSRNGETKVMLIGHDSNTFPIVTTNGRYTKEGKYIFTDKNPSLFHTKQDMLAYFSTVPKEKKSMEIEFWVNFYDKGDHIDSIGFVTENGANCCESERIGKAVKFTHLLEWEE